jgi:hypothetical protein
MVLQNPYSSDPIFLAADRRPSGEGSRVSWCQRLWAAVIRRSAVDWKLYTDHPDPKKRQYAIQARKWLFDNEEEDYLGSFNSVCEILGVSPELVRYKTKCLTEEQARRLRGMEFGDGS